MQPRGDYWVISTDYDSYAVVWSCSERSIPFLRFKWNTREFKLPVWIEHDHKKCKVLIFCHFAFISFEWPFSFTMDTHKTRKSILDHMSHIMTKPAFVICEQQRRRSACASTQSDQIAFVVRCLDNLIPLVSILKISRLYIAFVAA